MARHIDLIVDEDILKAAEWRCRNGTIIERDSGSPTDHLVGMLGEMMFVQWLWGDWRYQDPARNHGKVDIDGRIEVKSSAVQIDVARFMLAREDYVRARQAEIYVQCIFGTAFRGDHAIVAGMTCRIAGWASHAELAAAPLKTFTDKHGDLQNYANHALPLWKTRSMAGFDRTAFPRPASIIVQDMSQDRPKAATQQPVSQGAAAGSSLGALARAGMQRQGISKQGAQAPARTRTSAPAVRASPLSVLARSLLQKAAAREAEEEAALEPG